MALRDKLREDKNKQIELRENKVELIKDKSNELTMQDKVKKSAEFVNRHKAKKERFLWFKVWVNYLVSMFMKDRGKIPDNIGDKIMITNNMYITKEYMSIIIQIHELGSLTPITLIGVLNSELRKRGNKAALDITFKNSNYKYDPENSGLQSRIKVWENNLESNMVSKGIKERSAKCLYTVRLAQQGKQLKQSRMYLTVRAKDIITLNSAEKIIYGTLASMGSVYLPIRSNIKSTLEYVSLIGNRCEDLKETIPVMTTNVVLSQIVPNCGSYNDNTGVYIGQNILNGTPYYIDFNTISVARNMYCVAPSGVGKTVLALNMAQSSYENGSACVFVDIKGNEYTEFIKATGGYIVSLRPNSYEYINSWVMHKEDTIPELAESYFKSRVAFSKQQMIILSGIKDREALLELEELLDEFHDALYITYGVTPSNMNSWYATESLNPYEVFNKFENFLTPQKRKQYNINKTFLGTIRMYMSQTGSKSYVFKKEFDYSAILNADTLSFDFGILANTSISDVDLDLFRLKFLYMQNLNGEFTTKKYASGKRTFKILEESQVVSPEIMEMYVQEYTLRRSQNQDTLLLGNSVQALMDNKYARPLVENTRGLFVGELTKDAREIVLKQFGIQHLEEFIKIPGSTVNYKNCFAFINNMQDKRLYPIIQVQIEKDDNGKYKKYKVYTPTKEKGVMSGN